MECPKRFEYGRTLTTKRLRGIISNEQAGLRYFPKSKGMKYHLIQKEIRTAKEKKNYQNCHPNPTKSLDKMPGYDKMVGYMAH